MRSGAEPGCEHGYVELANREGVALDKHAVRERRRPKTSDTSGGAERTRHGYEPTGGRARPARGARLTVSLATVRPCRS